MEHSFRTVKKSWGLLHFLTRGLELVKTEASLAFLAYNMTRAINILGVKEIIKILKGTSYPFNLCRLHINNNWGCDMLVVIPGFIIYTIVSRLSKG